jgi:hypothetical protein
MGMHFGIIAGRVPLDSLIQALCQSGAELRFVNPIDSLADAPDDGDTTYIIAGEHAGASYLLDRTMVLSAGQADLLAAAARRAEAHIVGCGAETTSGTCWFSAFDGPNVLRMFFACATDLAQPFSVGQPLESEASCPLDMGWDGDGIVAALEQAGFDYNAWVEAGPFQLLALDDISGPVDQPLEDTQKEHWNHYRLVSDDGPEICVVQRPLGNITPPLGRGQPLASGNPTLWQGFRKSLRRRNSWRHPKAGVQTLFSGDK